jgi:hypothetical protein
MTTSFTSMATSTAEQWGVIGTETMADQGRTAERVLDMLGSLTVVVGDFAVDRLTKCLQTDTRAEQFADQSNLTSFDHDDLTEPLPQFEPTVRTRFATTHSL